MVAVDGIALRAEGVCITGERDANAAGELVEAVEATAHRYALHFHLDCVNATFTISDSEGYGVRTDSTKSLKRVLLSAGGCIPEVPCPGDNVAAEAGNGLVGELDGAGSFGELSVGEVCCWRTPCPFAAVWFRGSATAKDVYDTLAEDAKAFAHVAVSSHLRLRRASGVVLPFGFFVFVFANRLGVLQDVPFQFLE